jgi:predicted RNase H-like HicB family nuclease
MIYRIYNEKGEDFGYVVHCPALPGCHSQGDTIEEALENIKDAIRGYVELLDKSLLDESSSEKLIMDIAL